MRSIFYLKKICLLATIASNVSAFTIQSPTRAYHSTKYLSNEMNFGWKRRITQTRMFLSQTNGDYSLHKVPEDDDTAIPFVEVGSSSFIECYADSIAIINGMEYTIGSPCDHAVALCYFDDDDQLIPIELEDDLMDDIFNMAAR